MKKVNIYKRNNIYLSDLIIDGKFFGIIFRSPEKFYYTWYEGNIVDEKLITRAAIGHSLIYDFSMFINFDGFKESDTDEEISTKKSAFVSTFREKMPELFL